MTVLRTLVVGSLFLIALGLLGYLLVIHPEGPRLLGKRVPEPSEKAGILPPATQPPSIADPGEKSSGTEVAADAPASPPAARPSRRRLPASPPPQSQPPVAKGPSIPEERVRPPMPRAEEAAGPGVAAGMPPGADGMGTLSPEDIERIVEMRKAIQSRLGGS